MTLSTSQIVREVGNAAELFERHSKTGDDDKIARFARVDSHTADAAIRDAIASGTWTPKTKWDGPQDWLAKNYPDYVLDVCRDPDRWNNDPDIAKIAQRNTWANIGRAYHLIADEIKAAANIEPASKSGAADANGRRVSANARYIALLQAKPDAAGWTAKAVAAEINCAPSTLVATLTWKSLAMQRDKSKAERAKDRRRKPKASDIRRD